MYETIPGMLTGEERRRSEESHERWVVRVMKLESGVVTRVDI